MNTFHIHIKGIVQGVGFRPFVYKLALEMKLVGWVNNTSDGVHIQVNTNNKKVKEFFRRILVEKPKFSVITSSVLENVKFQNYSQFNIVRSEESEKTNLLVTQDFAMCEDCKEELFDVSNLRYQYPFITCTNCGPRYSIIKSLPYDRPTTTMGAFIMCSNCQAEYDNPLDRRYYSQTNSCPHCAIKLSIWEGGKVQKIDNEISFIVDAWKEGKIVAIKGIGGYLITCDAENFSAIKRLRKLKKRPTKPLAIMHPDLLLLAEDAEIIEPARLEMRGESSPIVLVNLIKNEDRVAKTAYNEIAPNLNHIGVMLPYTPLYELLLREFARPIIATSGNISGSTIIYENDKANQHLSKIADVIVLNDRPIVLPQDDSVIRYSYVKCQRIILRRSRGLAPSFLIKQSQNLPSKTVLCMGAMMKSTFSILFNGNIFVSQYLGNTEDFENQLNFNKTLNHLLNLLGAIPDIIVVDKHPNYYTRQYGYELAKTIGAEVIALQHHKAHFYSVLGEHGLLESDEKILGVVWDGTGYGEDGHIWGGEFFVFSHGAMERVRHLDYYDFILGDKMPKEPRISAFAISDGDDRVLEKFTEEEWRIYKILLAKDGNIQCSSAGRLFDAAASIILNIDKQSFEGEAAMRLESAAYEYFRKNGATIFYTYLSDEKIPENFPKFIIQKIMEDVAKGCEPAFLAAKFHITLANYISLVAKDIGVHKVVFSGGVFQNGWLVDLIYLFMQQDYELLFHVDLSPNDEGVSFGQLQSIINSTLVS